MQTQEIVKKAMSNRKQVSFKYHRIFGNSEEKIAGARIIFMTTDNFGKGSIAVNLPQEKNLAAVRYFDINSISNLKIMERTH